MANRIQIRHGSTTPTTSDLLSYELGWNDTNSRLYIKNGASTPSIITLNGPIQFGTGTNSAVCGNSSTIASGDYSFAFGLSSEATGYGAMAFINSIASAQAAFALGGKMSGENSTEASNIGAIAIGASSWASNIYAISIGNANTASGQASLSFGLRNNASGNYSIAIGRGILASSDNQLVIGKYNVQDSQGTYSFIIGNGTADNARSNALTIDQNGNVTATTFIGSLTGNATNVTGTVAIANGGTGATTAAGALTNLGISNVVLSDTSRKIYLTTTASVPSGAVTGDIVLVKVT